MTWFGPWRRVPTGGGENYWERLTTGPRADAVYVRHVSFARDVKLTDYVAEVLTDDIIECRTEGIWARTYEQVRDRPVFDEHGKVISRKNDLTRRRWWQR